MGKRANKFKAAEGGGHDGDPSALSAEVAAFASSLGLGAAAPSGDSAFDDFAPGVAKKRIGGVKSPKTKSKVDKAGEPGSTKGNRDGTDTNTKRQKRCQDRQGGGSAAADDDTAQEDGEGKSGKAKGRDWNVGAGPRPAAVANALAAGIGNLDEEGCWYEAAAALDPLPGAGSDDDSDGELDADMEEELRMRADKLEEKAAEMFESRLGKRNSAEARWLQLSRQSGTTADKVAAMTLLIQESAVANMKSLDMLLKWVSKNKGGKDVVGKAIDALRELFSRALLPDRPLVRMDERPLARLPPNKIGNRHLLYWHIEDSIKRRYAVFVGALDECSRDNIEFVKEHAVKAAYELLRSKPEQEGRLLAIVANKLGDPSRKLASKAGYLLLCLLDEHPGMKPVVVREVERFVFRPNLQDRARYYAVVFLNQVVLSHKVAEGGSKLAKQLLDIYFTLFRLVLAGKAGAQAEAVAREAEKEKPGKDKSGKGKGKPSSRGRGGRSGGRGGRGRGGGRRTPEAGRKGSGARLAKFLEMDARLLSGLLAGVRRAFPFVDDEEVEGLVDKHSPDLFRIVHSASLNTAVQALLLLYQLMDSRNAISDRFYRALYSVLLNPGLPRCTKAPMFMSLVLRSMKKDVSVKRIAAFAKRLLQVAAEQPPNFACGVLLVLSEVLKARASLWQSIMQPEDNTDGIERLHDVDEDGDDAVEADVAKEVSVQLDVPGEDESEEEEGSDSGDINDKGGSDDDALTGGKQSPQPKPTTKPSKVAVEESGYDMKKREPMYAGADGSAWWELTALAGHVHPSVAAMARTLMSGAPIVYKGNPLQDLALTPFLDKFTLKKAKAHLKGTSVMQPIASTASQRSTGDITSAAFSELAKGDVVPSDALFHKYFSLSKKRAESGKGKKKAKAGSDDEDSGASSDSDQELEFLEQQEEKGQFGVADGGAGGDFDYESLGAAMAQGEVHSSDSDGGSDGMEDDDFGGNVMELPSPSSSEGGEGNEDGGSDDDEDNLLQALGGENSDDLEGDSAEDEDEGKASKPKKQGPNKSGKSAFVFASADDYESQINAALAGRSDAPRANPSPSSNKRKAVSQGPSKSNHKRGRGRGRGRSRGRGNKRP